MKKRMQSQSPEAAYNPVCDLYLDGIIDEKDFQVFLMHWLAAAAL